MSEKTLHYIYDPLCGWCYAAMPMVQAVISAGVPVTLYGGALWNQPTQLDAARREYIGQNDGRIAALTGLPFGAAYFDGVLANADTVLWSQPTIASVLAAGVMRTDADLDMLTAIQTAHYVSGRHVTEEATLIDLATAIDLSPDEFTTVLRNVQVDAHITQTRRLMTALNLRGFPSFLLQVGETLTPVQHEHYYANPHAFVDAVHQAAARVAF